MRNGFESIEEMRQLERVPPTVIGAALAGEINVTATAKVAEKTVKSFYTKTDSIYYYYLHEEERTDSDGDKYWATVDSKIEAVDFFIEDKTGRIRVDISENWKPIDWSLPESFSVTKGDQRYTEWRLEANDQVFIFAKAHKTEQGLIIAFNKGQYTPIISKYSEEEERADMGLEAILLLWLGLSFIALGVFFFITIIRVHRLLVYILFLTIVQAFNLINMGLEMMQHDLENGMQRYQQQYIESENTIKSTLENYGHSWQNWSALGDFFDDNLYNSVPATERLKLTHIRLNLAVARAQLKRHITATPEKWLAPGWNIYVPAPIEGLSENDKQTLQKRLEQFIPTHLSYIGTSIFSVIAIILSYVLSYFGIKYIRVKRLIENIPTSKTTGVVFGIAEVCGKLILDHKTKPLMPPLSKIDSSWYHYIVKEKRGSGKNSKWVTITDRIESIKCYCEDEEGQLLLDANKAEVITKHVVKETVGNRSYKEYSLRINDPLYAIGFASVDNEGDKLILTNGEDKEPFILSNLSETEVMLNKARRGMCFLNFGFSFFMLAPLLLFSAAGGFASTDFLLSSLLAPLFMMFITFILHYNDMIFLRERVERNRSNIEVALKKRHDLIPNLEKIVKAYLQHEKDLQTNIASLRSHYEASLKDETRLDSFIAQGKQLRSQINALQEHYANLKADKLMRQFMDSQIKMENELALMRSGYNDAVEVYNARLSTIPDIIFTKLAGFKEKKLIRN